MGNKLLIFLLFFLINFSYANDSFKNIDNLIEKIKIKRVGLNSYEIKKLKDPFFYSNKRITLRAKRKLFNKTIKPYYRLSAIFNDKAKINGRWYKIGSRVGKYRLFDICRNYVKLKRNKKVLTLFLTKKSKRVKITIE